MIALSLALAYLGSLAFAGWLVHYRNIRPLPPHDALVKRVETFEERLRTVEAWGNIKHGEGPFHG